MGCPNTARHRTGIFVAAVCLALCTSAGAADDGPVVGTVIWKPGLEPDANSYDKTDFWAAIAYSESTGKFGASCNWTADINASRSARENCNTSDARTVVMCNNGWCALALGEDRGKWGVGWGEDRPSAERFALQSAKERTRNAKVVFSINAREMRLWGAIAYSESTGDFGYATGGGRSSQYAALKNCKASDAKVLLTKYDCWLALAVGDGKSFGYGFAGNRADAEQNALDECAKHGEHGKIKVSFCTNGVEAPVDENRPATPPVAPRESTKTPVPDVAALIQSLKDPQGAKRVTAAAQLGQLGAAAASAVPALREAVKDPDVNVRAVAEAALVKIESSLKAAGRSQR